MKIRTNIIVSLLLAFITTYMIIAFTQKKEKAPRLPAMVDVQGKPFDPGVLKNKVYILSYFQTWCSDCVKEQPQLQKLQERFGADKLQILMVSDEPLDKINMFRERFTSSLDFYHTDTPLKSEAIGVKKFPTTYLISKKGRVEEVKVEGINWYTDDMIALIESLLK